jgi:hypothetical protein
MLIQNLYLQLQKVKYEPNYNGSNSQIFGVGFGYPTGYRVYWTRIQKIKAPSDRALKNASWCQIWVQNMPLIHFKKIKVRWNFFENFNSHYNESRFRSFLGSEESNPKTVKGIRLPATSPFERYTSSRGRVPVSTPGTRKPIPGYPGFETNMDR